jgi:hypothetical protein
MRYLKLCALLGALTVAVSACGGEDANGPVVGDDSQYVVSSILLPATPQELTQFSHDFYNNKTYPNQIGTALRSVNVLGKVDLQPQLNKAVAIGEVVLLINARTQSQVSAKNSGSWLFLGDNDQITPPACTDPEDLTSCSKHLDGNGVFTLSATSPLDSLLRGKVQAGTFAGGPGEVILPLSLSPDAPPLELHLVGAHTKFSFDANDLVQGSLAGGIPTEEMNTVVLPGVHQLVSTIIARDCQGPGPGESCCMANSTGSKVLEFLNTDSDCMVTEAEFTGHQLIRQLLGPDVDLMNGSEYGPNKDKVLDAVSIGLGFTAVKASFDLPADLAN